MAARKQIRNTKSASGNQSSTELLIAKAKEGGQNEVLLREMLWRLQAHPELAGLIHICRHLREILALAAGISGFSLTALEMDIWDPILEWILAEKNSLADDLFPNGRDSRLKDNFLQSAKNPILGIGAKRHGLCCLLWASHPTLGDSGLQRNSRLLQAHILRAHVSIVRHLGPHEIWDLEQEPYPGFRDSLYLPTLAARRFLRRFGVWSSALRDLPLQSDVEELPDELRQKNAESATVAATPQAGIPDNRDHPVSPHNVSQARASIAGFLEWGSAPEFHSRRTHDGHGLGGGGEWIGSEGDKEDCKTGTTTNFGDADGVHQHAGNLQHTFHRKFDPGTSRELLASDMDPNEYLLTPSVSLADDAAAAAIATGGWADKANQMLPWSYSLLSSFELAHILREMAGRLQRPEDLEFHAMVQTMLWTGSSLEQAMALLVCVKGTPAPDCDLSFSIQAATNADSKVSGAWRVRALALPYRTLQQPMTGKDRERTDYFVLPDLAGVSESIQVWLRYLRDVVKAPAAQAAAMRRQPFRIFCNDDYETRLPAFLREIDPSGRITISKIQRALFQHIVERTGGDLASAALLTRTDHYLASVRRFYATPTITHLQNIYRDAVGNLATKLAQGGYSVPQAFPVSIEKNVDNNEAVGSRLCPTRHAVQSAIASLRSKVWKKRIAGADESFLTEFVGRHNKYTLYCVWSFGLAVGVRGIRTPYLHSTAMDSDSGFATISDKDSGAGYHLRLIWVPPKVRQQMQLYEAYLSSLKNRGLPPARRNQPCYFVDPEKPVKAA